MADTRRILRYAVAGLVVVVLGYLALRPSVVELDTAVVTTGPLRVTVGDEGQTRSRHRHLVTAPVAGRIERIALEVGDSIAAGTVVARLAPVALDPRTREQATAALAAARDLERLAAATVAQAGAALQQATDDRQRMERLLPSGGVAEADVARLRLAEEARAADLEAAGARQRAAGHDVRAAQSALLAAGTPGGPVLAVACPMGGRVLAIPDQSARTVAPGEVLLEVGNPADLEIVVDLLSTDAVQVTPGDRMLVTGWGGEGTLEGRVLRVDPAGFTKISALGVEEQRVNVVGVLEETPVRLGDRFRVSVRVVLWEDDQVLKIPSSALFRRGSDWAVFVVEGGRARERIVEVGRESGSESQVLGGLREGDVVVRHPTDRVAEGVRVRGRNL